MALKALKGGKNRTFKGIVENNESCRVVDNIFLEVS